MPIALPESVKKVLEDKAYGHVITFNPNGPRRKGARSHRTSSATLGSSSRFRIVPNRSPISFSTAPRR